ncbi:MAG: hypothetical protein SAK29_24550 [Scytonema sp. PMC 1069.18]|nr:hypothetical protein [Scytonema sp. PMC 1069.18]MEC4885486.1 hypothetical protein [Scytonema sp. PMC 1070.18]
MALFVFPMYTTQLVKAEIYARSLQILYLTKLLLCSTFDVKGMLNAI